MSHHTRSIHAQAGLHRKLVLFGAQLELYLAHFPSHHKYPSLISAIRSDARHGRLQALISRLGQARRTCSHRPLITHLLEHHHALAARLPQSHHRHQHV